MGIDPDIFKSVGTSLSLVKYTLTVSLPVLWMVKFCDQAGFFRHLDRFSNIAVRYTLFHNVTGRAFLANLGSVYAGSALLMHKYEKGEICRANLVLSVIFAGFLPRIRILFTHTLPVATPLLGLAAAMFYAGFFLLIAVSRLLISASLSRILLDREDAAQPPSQPGPFAPAGTGRPDLLQTAKTAMGWALRMGGKIILHILAITSLFTYLNLKGVFSYIPLSLDWLGLPPGCISAFYAYIAHTYSGMAIIGEFLSSGRLETLEGIRLLLFCTMATKPVVMLKEAPSYYFGVYGLKNGSLIILFDMVVMMTLGTAVFGVLSLF